MYKPLLTYLYPLMVSIEKINLIKRLLNFQIFLKYFVLIPRYVVSVMFLQNTDFILVSVRHNPVTVMNQSEPRRTSHLMRTDQ